MHRNKRNSLRIGLIYPNRYEKFKIDVPSFFKLPPLNLLTIAALTPEQHKIEIIDERYEKD